MTPNVHKFLQNSKNLEDLKRYMFGIRICESITTHERLLTILYSEKVLERQPEYLAVEYRDKIALSQHIIDEAFKRRRINDFFLALKRSGNEHVVADIYAWIQRKTEQELDEAQFIVVNSENMTEASGLRRLSGIEPEEENRSQAHLLVCNTDDETAPKRKRHFVRELITLLCLVLVALPLFLYLCLSQPNTNAGTLYTTNQTLSFMSSSDPFNLIRLVNSSNDLVREVSYDVKSEHIYYTTESESKVKLYRIDQKNSHFPVTPLREFTSDSPSISIAYDWIADRIYFAHYETNTIEVCRRGAAEGSCFEIVKPPKSKINTPDYLVVHSPQGLLFWVNAVNTNIGRSKMDGTDVTSFGVSNVIGHKIEYITGLAADMSHAKLYYTMVEHNEHSIIVSTNLDGQNPITILSRGTWIASVDILDNRVYWLEDKQILSSCSGKDLSLRCGRPTIVVEKEKLGINHFAVYNSRQQPQSRQNHCKNGNECSDLCVLSGKTSFTCLCPPSQILGPDKKTCEVPNESDVLKNINKTVEF